MALSPDKFYTARVTYRRDVAEDLWVIRLAPGGEYHFVAGQYATLGIPFSGARHERPYTLVSSPYESEIELFLERVPQGELTPSLYNLQVGDEVSLRKIAKGRFTLDLKSGHRNHLLLCTVTGVAPYLSYIRTLHADWKANRFPAEIRLYLIQGASRSHEFGYREELEGVAAEVPWLTYVPTVSRPWEDSAWTGERGRVDDVIRKYVDQWQLSPADTTPYLCGHPGMVQHGMAILERAGFAKHDMKQEVYWIPKAEAEIQP
ncbi:MAG TPA: FAD-binding oxidoreductase [Candidatus Limnocylindrales bacterium]|nr:FAD-binding oxidoreductase [Candidatus Limnocylindrales bacterium]